MEPKIGEIFEYNCEWYQCIKGDPIINADGIINYCEGCSLSASECDNFNCIDYERSDKELVIFKKLEKVGEPFKRNGYMYQEYKAYTFPLLMNGDAKIPTPNGFAVIIKQNKEEDMKTVRINKDDLNFLVNTIRYGILPKCTDYDEIVAGIIELFSVEDVNLSNNENIGKNLREFDLEAAKSGKPVCTRDGRKARIICFDKQHERNIVALITERNEECACTYTSDGSFYKGSTHKNDLMMLFEKKEGWVNVYKGNNGISERVCGDIVSNTKEEATQYAQNDDSYITTVKIEWEE